MVGALIAGAAAAVGASAWAVRGRSSQVFGPSIWRGPTNLREIALTFDDGPSPDTPALLETLAKHSVPATFFMCGMHVRRLPGVARQVASVHEIGNHTDTHQRLWMRGGGFLRQEIARAQHSIEDVCGRSPRFFRPPYGVRWFGLRTVLDELRLTQVMWTAIGRDWVSPAPQIAQRLGQRACNGAIYCLHDGRERDPMPDIKQTIKAVETLVPFLQDRGWIFSTITNFSDTVVTV